MGQAEDRVRRSGAAVLAAKDAPWRQHPATENQIATLAKLRIAVPPRLTKGEASDLIGAALARQSQRQLVGA